MRYFKFNKLVRDKVVENMIQNKQVPVGIRVLSDEEFEQELIKKLAEEVSELKDVKSKDELLDELVDVVEILNYIKKQLQISTSEINEKVSAKKKKSGGFDNKVYIEKVGVLEGSEWINYYQINSDRYPET